LRIDSEVIVPFRLGCCSTACAKSGGDVPREEFLDAVDGMIGDASQHLAECVPVAQRLTTPGSLT
jgi:hypothetical protein